MGAFPISYIHKAESLLGRLELQFNVTWNNQYHTIKRTSFRWSQTDCLVCSENMSDLIRFTAHQYSVFTCGLCSNGAGYLFVVLPLDGADHPYYNMTVSWPVDKKCSSNRPFLTLWWINNATNNNHEYENYRWMFTELQ